MEHVNLPIQEQLSPQVLERFDRPRNYGPLSDFNGHARITGPCGDTMEFWIQVSQGRIVHAGFTTTGCGPSRAAGSMATELAVGKLLEESVRIEQADILSALRGLPKQSEHCALLASNTFKAAIQDFVSRESAEPLTCQHGRSTDCSSHEPRHVESEEEYRRQQALAQRMSRVGYKLLVMSGKGGVGKSTVAANLAVSLALAGKTVGLLDVDIHGPSIPRLMGLEGRHTVVRGSEMLPLQIDENLKVMSIGFLLSGAADAVIWRGPMKYGVIRQFLSDVAWGELDYLVIDAPPGTGDEPLSVAQLVGQPAGAVLVTTPQELSVADVRRSVSFCQKVSLPVLGIIENMSGLVCPHCGGSIAVFKTGGGEALAREMGVPMLGRIPMEPKIVECGDDGVAFVRRFAASAAAAAFAEFIARIREATDAAVASSGPPLPHLERSARS